MPAKESISLAEYSLEHAPDAVYWIARDGSFAYVNQSACRSLGYARDELLKLHVHDIDPLMTADQWLEHWQNSKKRGSFTIEREHRNKSGDVFPVEVSIHYLQHDGHEYHCSFVRDITERKKSEDEIRIHRQQLDTIIETSSDIIFLKDREFRYLIANKAHEKLFHTCVENIIGKTDFDFMTREEAGLCRQSDQLALASNELVCREENVAGRYFESTKHAVRGADGNVVGVVGVIHECTERKLREDALRENEEKLKAHMQETERFNAIAIGRELRMIELKKEVNTLLAELGRKGQYTIHKEGVAE